MQEDMYDTDGTPKRKHLKTGIKGNFTDNIGIKT